MPNLQNAKKALRQAQKRTAENNVVKRAYKLAVKNVTKASNKGEDVTQLLQVAQEKLDKAAKKGVLKKNTAARKLSRLVKRVRPSTTK